jgi:ligand-binding SRPBCC domain-containing protein
MSLQDKHTTTDRQNLLLYPSFIPQNTANMQVKKKEWTQFIPRPLDEVWHFFSRPENLNDVTPGDMSFIILSDIRNLPMYEGMIICYKISPFAGIKMNWVTEITHIADKKFFVDEQRFGPYAMWHHEHHFQEQDGGVLMRDILHYKVPYGPIGSIADALFVDQKIEQIFSFRKQTIDQLFK